MAGLSGLRAARHTRREHFREAAEHLGLRACTSADGRDLLDCATKEAMSTDKGSAIAQALLRQLRDRRIILPAPSRIERIAVAGRARARRLTADAMIVDIVAGIAVRIDGLLVYDPALKEPRSRGCAIGRKRRRRQTLRRFSTDWLTCAPLNSIQELLGGCPSGGFDN